MKMIEDLAPNFRTQEIDCCATCKNGGVDQMGVVWCGLYEEDIGTGLDLEDSYIINVMTHLHGICDLFERKEYEKGE